MANAKGKVNGGKRALNRKVIYSEAGRQGKQLSEDETSEKSARRKRVREIGETMIAKCETFELRSPRTVESNVMRCAASLMAVARGRRNEVSFASFFPGGRETPRNCLGMAKTASQ